MKVISDLADQIECEIRNAEKYIDCALHKKEEYPALAETYYKLSEERMKDQSMLHEQVVALINEYKKTKGEEPSDMKFLYDYLHGKFEDWALRVKIKQNEYKSV